MSNEFTTVISGETYLKALSDEPIEPDDISVEVEAEGTTSDEANMIPLSILWAYFQAQERDLITEDEPTPWEDSQGNSHLSDQEVKEWIQFLDTILTDDWTTWIQDPDEIRQRSIAAYNQLQQTETTKQQPDKSTSDQITSLEETLGVQFELSIETEVDDVTVNK
ncbi:hypothetical protein JCM16358_01730 [Halanaerocella petrolearia]